MKTGWIITVVVAVISFAAGSAADVINMDIGWWHNTVPDSARTYVVEGMLDAYVSGWTDGVTDEGARFEREARDISSSFAAGVSAISNRKIDNGKFAAFEQTPVFSHTFGFYSAAIEDFYHTHSSQNAQSATIGEILRCLQDNSGAKCSYYK